MLGRRKTKDNSDGAKAAPAPVPVAKANVSPAPVSAQPHKCLGEMLTEVGLVTQEQLDEAIGIQDKEGGFLGQVLVQCGFVTQEAVASCLVKQCKIPHLSLLDYEINSDVLEFIPEETCRKYNLLPIDKLGRILTVAMVDPLDMDALTAIRAACPELRIKPILCNWAHYDIVSQKVFGDSDDRNHKNSNVTAESLGLGRLGIPAAAPRPAPEAELPTAIPDAPEDGIEEIVTAQQPEAGTDPFIPAARPASDMPQAVLDTEGLANALRDSMREALQEVVATFQPAQAPMAQPQFTPADMAAALRDALQESLVAITSQAEARLAPPAPAENAMAPGAPVAPAFTPEDMAIALRNALQGPLEAITHQVQALATPTQVHGVPQENQTEALSEAIRSTVQEMLTANQAAQSEQSQQLNKITEATLQSVQQATTLMQSKAEARDVEEEAKAKEKEKENRLTPSVSEFSDEKLSGGESNDDTILASLASDMPTEKNVFENYITGSNNEFSYKLCQAVAAKPGGEYNPLFLYGNVGIGKTHLLCAMGNAIRTSFPNMRVGYVTASRFSERLNEALRKNLVDVFRESYSHWDVLILDDIQFLNRRPEAQEEFFHIFNVLYQAQRQIIIASDKAPDQLGLLEERLVSRFASGVVAELKSPDWDTRMKILHQCVSHSSVNVPDEVMAHIAMRVKKDIRKMTGALRKIVAYAELVGNEITCEMAEEILHHLGTEEAA